MGLSRPVVISGSWPGVSAVREVHNEVTRRARLDTLQRAAAALDCDLVYALVPRRPLEQMVDARARAVANELLGSVGHSMALEGQQVSQSAAQDQLLEQALRLRDGAGLWRDER